MRLGWYWFLWSVLVLYAIMIYEKTLIHRIFVVFLCIYLVFLVVATISLLIKRMILHLYAVRRENHIRKRDATTESPLEIKLAKALDNAKIRYQREYLISRTRVDFAFPEEKLAVECDGFRYHSSPESRVHDARRDAFLKGKGWRVLRLSGAEIHSDIGACIRRIRGQL